MSSSEPPSGPRLAFGTAGLRAPVGPGLDRMNDLVVRQTTAGVMRWLSSAEGPGVDAPTIVIGFDARLDSQDFAAAVAETVRVVGGRALLADRPVPTPVVAHAVRTEGADAGVVITASHNPPADNGYKLYLGDGRQLPPPLDEQIAAVIDEEARSWGDHPAANVAVGPAAGSGVASVDASVWIEQHRVAALHAVETLLGGAIPGGAGGATRSGESLRTVYTPMHGVGAEATHQLMDAAGYERMTDVPSQIEPDGRFPTVSFPNPEEPGALDEAMRVAAELDAGIIIAQDPDADRLALAVARADSPDPVVLSGDELGALLADHILRSTRGPRLVARSVVSSRLLDRIAGAADDVACAVTLTGFKWISRAADDHPGRAFVFGYEEAIGYQVGNHVLDKDGITAALAVRHMLGALAAQGETVWDRLDELARRHGLHCSRPVSIRFDDDPAAPARLIARFQQEPPTSLAGAPITANAIGGDSLPETPGVELHAEDGSRVIIRPSGTEPKLKAYVEVIESIGNGAVASARAVAEDRLDRLGSAVSELLQS
ncbi:MAG: phospho-sugar mutase [Actinomycetota bacterium]